MEEIPQLIVGIHARPRPVELVPADERDRERQDAAREDPLDQRGHRLRRRRAGAGKIHAGMMPRGAAVRLGCSLTNRLKSHGPGLIAVFAAAM
jgi:hypothetical protein